MERKIISRNELSINKKKASWYASYITRRKSVSFNDTLIGRDQFKERIIFKETLFLLNKITFSIKRRNFYHSRKFWFYWTGMHFLFDEKNYVTFKETLFLWYRISFSIRAALPNFFSFTNPYLRLFISMYLHFY